MNPGLERWLLPLSPGTTSDGDCQISQAVPDFEWPRIRVAREQTVFLGGRREEQKEACTLGQRFMHGLWSQSVRLPLTGPVTVASH